MPGIALAVMAPISLALGWMFAGRMLRTHLDTGQAVLVIANTGFVAPPDRAQRLFEPFQRLQLVSDNAHHGLGL